MGHGQVGDEPPVVAAILGDVDAAVVADDDVLGVVRVDPHRLLIDVDGVVLVGLGEGATTVGRDAGAIGQDVDAVRIGRITSDLRRRSGVHPFPARAAVVGPVHTLLRRPRGDRRVDAIGVRRADRQADLPGISFRQPAGKPLPSGATVGAPVHAAFGAAAEEAPGPPLALKSGGVQQVGVTRIHRQVDDAGQRADVQHQVPALSAVGALVHAAFLVRSPQRTPTGDVHDVRMFGMDQDTADVAGLLEPFVLPGLAAVLGLVDTVSPRHAAPVPRLSRAQPDDTGVGRGDGDRAERRGVAVGEDRLPDHAPVGRLPGAAGGGGDVQRVRIAGHAGDVCDTARGQRRPDLTPLQRSEMLGGNAAGTGALPVRTDRRRQGDQGRERDPQGNAQRDRRAGTAPTEGCRQRGRKRGTTTTRGGCHGTSLRFRAVRRTAF